MYSNSSLRNTDAQFINVIREKCIIDCNLHHSWKPANLWLIFFGNVTSYFLSFSCFDNFVSKNNFHFPYKTIPSTLSQKVRLSGILSGARFPLFNELPLSITDSHCQAFSNFGSASVEKRITWKPSKIKARYFTPLLHISVEYPGWWYR